jgi:hypothetical protein
MIMILYVSNSFSQRYRDSKISLLSHTTSLKLSCVPFDRVIVLDNRIDTSKKIYTYETGQYPLAYLSFDHSAKDEIKDYISRVIGPLQKDNRTLLIDINELHIPNYGVRKTAYNNKSKSAYRRGNTRDYINLSAQLFLSQSNKESFKRFATVKVSYYMRPTADLNADAIRTLLNELIFCTTVYNDSCAMANGMHRKKQSDWYNDNSRFIYNKDTIEYTIDKINITATDRWAQLPPFRFGEQKDGLFKTFYDFRENKLTPGPISLSFVEQDSCYKINSADSSRLLTSTTPWAIYVAGNYYFRLGTNCFIRLNKKDNFFEFYVPQTLPDFYTLVSMRENSRLGYTSTASTGNIIADLASIFVVGVVDEVGRAHRKRKILEGSELHDFRICTVDMDCGDILY